MEIAQQQYIFAIFAGISVWQATTQYDGYNNIANNDNELINCTYILYVLSKFSQNLYVLSFCFGNYLFYV